MPWTWSLPLPFSWIALEDKLLITTGRLTSEILIKVAKVGLPVLVSRNTAPPLPLSWQVL